LFIVETKIAPIGPIIRAILVTTLVMRLVSFNPSRLDNFLTMEIFNELFHFDIFLHMDVLEIFNFNHTKKFLKIVLESKANAMFFNYINER